MRNSIVENQFNDDLTMRNYMALLACILNPKLNYKSSLKLFDISDRNEIEFDKENNALKKIKKIGCKDYRKIKVIDTLTNEELIFNSVYEAESYTGIKKENIYVYIQRQILGKRRYKFSYQF
ncbi:MAG: hypothetical protein KIB00_17735 [Paeniclostridium sordellii]|nr:hypothetical protein [Paeniclostridium sordellii]